VRPRTDVASRAVRGRRRRSFVALLAGIAAAGYLGGSSAGARETACTAGVHNVGGVKVRTFCGPAKATAHVSGKTFHFHGGKCELSGGYFTVNIGSITIAGPGVKPKFSYLGIDVKPPRPGLHHNQVVSWSVPGKGYTLFGATVTVKSGLKGGTFTGHLIVGGNGSGSFSCS